MSDIEKQAADFWCHGSSKQRDLAHWFGHGRFKDDIKMWRSIGVKHIRMFQKLRVSHNKRDGPMDRMLEWGPGGGTNVIAFGEFFGCIVGVDISTLTLDECKQVAEKKCPGVFQSFPIDIDHPEVVRGLGPFDFFLTTAVIQHMPSKEWVARCLKVMAREMREAGQALVQFRECQSVPMVATRYIDNIKRWCVFDGEEFVELCGESGWHVLQYIGKGSKSGYAYVYLEKM